MTRNEAFDAIREELYRAEQKHPNWPNDIFKQIAIINEEAGQTTKAILHYIDENGSFISIQEELIQTAAVCVRMLISLKDFTCYNCKIVKTCEVAFDDYNTNGDCLNK